MQACTIFTPDIYQAKSKSNATLLIDLPSQLKSKATIYYYDKNAPSSKKVWNGARSLVYGYSQFETKIKLSTNVPFDFYFTLTPRYGLTCTINASFVPKADKVYRLTGGTENPDAEKNKNRGFFSPRDLGKCYVIVEMLENGQNIPVYLEKFDT